MVVKQVLIQAGHTLIESALAEEGSSTSISRDSLGHLFINRALSADDDGNLAVAVSLQRSLIGVGAPAATYLTPLAEKLNTKLSIPDFAEVANAIGAVAGRVVQNVRILIRQPWGKGTAYRVYLPFGVRDFAELEDAASYARNTASRLARRRAHQAGASRVKVYTKRNDQIVTVYGERLYLGTEIMATAVGYPRPKG
jgi:N-methylhydantoinase A/oxoprolinase/acetone carboxylase beta subunit